jgi:Undecaprenyl-phosphate glucose phosphotransferase
MGDVPTSFKKWVFQVSIFPEASDPPLIVTNKALQKRAILVSRYAAPVARLFDLVFPPLLCWFTSAIYLRLMHENHDRALMYVSVGLLGGVLFVSFNQALGLYRRGSMNDAPGSTARVAAIWIATWLFIVFFGFLLKVSSELSRGALVIVVFAGLVPIIASRYLLARTVASLARSGRERVGLLWLGDAPNFGRPLRQSFDVTCACAVPLDQGATKRNESIRDFVRTAKMTGVDRVLVSVSVFDSVILRKILPQLRHLQTPVTLCADEWTSKIYGSPVRLTSETVGFELEPTRATATDLMLKRAIDIGFTLGALPFLLPVLAVVACATKLDSSGPVLFRQRRVGLDGREFTILKFRTMRVMEDGDQVTQARRNDDRVTRVGAFLRASSIDELPQLFNVLRGDMGLVGPRPHAVSHDRFYEDQIEDYALRRSVKPGLTGWAQINGSRGETATVDMMKRRIELDRWYVFNWTVWVDVRILFATVLSVIRNKDVY